MAGVHVCKSKRVKNMQNYTSKKFWSLWMFINWGKNLISQPLQCKKNCCEICNIFYQQIIFILFYFIVIGFLYTLNLKFIGFTFFFSF